jgi:hypothetical protein
VTVNKGGQAIVGNVQSGAPMMKSDEVSSPPLLDDQSGSAFMIESGAPSAKQRLRSKR